MSPSPAKKERKDLAEMNKEKPEASYKIDIEEKPEEQKLPWYYKSWVIVIAILCFGPLGLIPLWFRPRTQVWVKVAISVIVIALTVWMTRETAAVYKRLMQSYEELGQVMQDM